MTPYESEVTVTTTGSNQVVPIKYPGRCTLDRVSVVKLGGGSLTLTLFNRAFTGASVPLRWIVPDGSGNFCQLYFKDPFPVKVGDVVTVSNAAVSGYNTEHRVTGIVDGQTVVTDVAFAGQDGGTAADAAMAGQITIPAAEQPLYQVLQLTGSGAASVLPDETFVNLDPLPNVNIGINGFLYARFAAADTYKLAIRSHSSVGEGG